MIRFIHYRTLMLIALPLIAFMCTQEVKEKYIPITAGSETALDLYYQAMDAAEDVYIGKALELFEEALEEDPDFFMAAYQLALFNFFFNNQENFQKFSREALTAETQLSEGEVIFRSILEGLTNDPGGDFTALAGQLVELYPDDEQSYMALAFTRGIIQDNQGVVDAYEKALGVTDDNAFIYNALGYVYMNMEQFEDAEKALDTYLEMEPDLPNPYDSKGDYFMRVEKYGKAYESFMRAHEIDSTWSYSKAMKAQEMMDSLQMGMEDEEEEME